MRVFIVASLLACTVAAAQIQSFETQAVDTVQRILVSKLDKELPGSAFGLWFTKITGPGAGVVWQLTECGESPAAVNETERDLFACAEANAVLPDGRQVIVAVRIGTFKKGITGEPIFYSAVIEQKDQLYRIRRLRDLPGLLREPEKLPIQLPAISANIPLINSYSQPIDFSSLKMNSYPWTESEPPPAEVKASPMLRGLQRVSGPQKPQEIQEGVLRSSAVSMVKPEYPLVARKMNIGGEVKVRIIISEDGRVIDAKAMSGNLMLRTPAMEAARKWVFPPTIVNGVAVRAESILTFVFDKNSN